ncbi:hypothetical protein FB465_7192 [Kitasatospora atroaurantiaca]|uniref:Uncharacterized protein n=2 Tax=Kitasatospora atroaurantiaca TaxID=285545 RepID=A0A561F243_9ACTN|nr:hypothetical protein FB465_0014 [Kitasatospora atroaurantiaca]TWE21935.1 hypothetical protein FB465_7192 [Kitasatospora atroaurantiaca]
MRPTRGKRVNCATTRAPKVSDPPGVAHRRMRDIIGALRRLGNELPTRGVRGLVESLSMTVKSAGQRVTPAQREEADEWLARGRGAARRGRE